jgi:hypothetical protein
VMSDASDDPVAEAVRAAATAQRHSGSGRSQASPAGDEHEGVWQTLGSHLSHEIKIALSAAGRAEVAESDANFVMATNQANAIAHTLRAYAAYRAQPWLDDDGRPVEIPAIDLGNPVAGQAELMIRLTANEPLTRPATNADWIDPLINLTSTAAMASGPTLRLAGPISEAAAGGMEIPAAGSEILIGKSGFRGIGEFTDAVTKKYQQLYDQHYAGTLQLVSRNLIPNDPFVIGGRTDALARVDPRDWLQNFEGINEGPGQIIQVNRRLHDPLGTGNYRVPDVYIPGSQTILDGSLQYKTSSMSQIADFKAFSGGANVILIRPASAPSNLVAGSYGIVY